MLVQVNVAGEDAEGRLRAGRAPRRSSTRSWRSGSTVDGLMTVPPLVGDPRPHFARVARARGSASGLRELSMGMSGDFEAAIAEGATIVRVGRAVFGPRP